MRSKSSYRVAEDVIFREVGGELMLMHLSTGYYFGLNAVGGKVWEHLQSGRATVAKIARLIADDFSMDSAEVEADVTALIADLLRHGLLEVDDS